MVGTLQNIIKDVLVKVKHGTYDYAEGVERIESAIAMTLRITASQINIKNEDIKIKKESEENNSKRMSTFKPIKQIKPIESKASVEYRPDSLLRIKDVLKIIPVSRATWWRGVKDGRFPQPVSIGPRMTAFRYKDILQLINEEVK